MRLIKLLAAASEWARALAGPFLLLGTGVGLLVLAWAVGVDRYWPIALVGALGVGIAMGGIGLTVCSYNRRQRETRRRTDGEGEPL